MSQPKTNFLIITALEEERDAVLDKLPEMQEVPPSDDDIRTYYSSNLPVTFPGGTTGTYRIVVTLLLGMGRVQAANATSDAIRQWQPNYVLLVGIAGGFANAGVRLGDVLVSDQIVDYELQKITSDGPQVRYEVHRANARLLGASQNLRGNGWQEKISTKRPENGVPVRHIGPILSGDKSVAVSRVLAQYTEDWSKLIGIEMEAGGVASASFQAAQRPGFFMIRGVSDLANEDEKTHEVQQWRSYACDVAASYTVALLESGRVPLISTSINISVKELNKSELNRLKELLRISELTKLENREQLAKDINYPYQTIPDFRRVSDENLAKQIVDYFWQRGLINNLRELCKRLKPDFEGGKYSSELEEIGKNLEEIEIKNSPNKSSISLEDRKRLIDKVRKDRVEQFLKDDNLINKKLIPIGLEKLPIVKTPEVNEDWEREGHSINEQPQKLDQDTKIINIFNQMGDKRTLLILGEPGSGKTTILAELTKELIERAKTGNNLPIPVILNLSSWKKQTIDKWSVEQLKDSYQVSEEKGWDLVNNHHLLLLIDGFDELKSEAQKSCVDAFNDFIDNNKSDSTKIVICSRTDDKDNENEEKEKLLQELTSQITVRLKSLELEEAVRYLNENSVPDWLKELVNTNNKLQNLIKVPLFLYLIIEVYKHNNSQNTDISPLDSEAKIWDKIFKKYIEKQLNQWKSTQNSSEELDKDKEKEKVERYLTWLANQMHKENQTDFLIEKMQPKWLRQPSNQVTFKEKIYHIRPVRKLNSRKDRI